MYYRGALLLFSTLLVACGGQSAPASSSMNGSLASSEAPSSTSFSSAVSAPASQVPPASSATPPSSSANSSSSLPSSASSSSRLSSSSSLRSSQAASSSTRPSSSSLARPASSQASNPASSSSRSAISSSSLSSRSSQGSSSSSPNPSCASAISRGEALWTQSCVNCHGNWPTDGRDVFVNATKGRTIDLFHSTRDFYRDKQKQAIMSNVSLPEFIQTYMLTNGTRAQANDVTAYLTAKTRGSWCPGDNWPPTLAPASSAASTSSASSSSSSGAKTRLTHVVFAYGAVGSDPEGDGGWGHHDPTGEGIKFLVNQSGWPAEEGFKASLISLQDSPNAFIDILKKAKTGEVPSIDAIVFQGAFGKVLWTGNSSNTEAVRLFQEYIDNGGGYAGFHTVVYLDKENQWNYWWQNIMLGKCCVKGHPEKPPQKIVVEYPDHPINKALSKKEYSLNQLPAGQAQFYGFSGNLRSDKVGDVNYNPYYKVILSSPYAPGTQTSQGAALTPADRFPYAWAYDFYPDGRGRTFTTILGNKQVFMSNSEWREFIKASIRWVAGIDKKPQ